VGGAKLVLGLNAVLPPDRLTIVANTGDDFEHLGLRICPDLDSVFYALAGLNDQGRGWGRAADTTGVLDELARFSDETWFWLGDKDIALHLERTRRLHAGESLTQATQALVTRLGLTCRLLPMSDDIVSTLVETADGLLPFQHYFVREQCAPEVRGFRFDGAENAAPQPEFMAALADPSLQAVVICPSNPFISIDPILALPAVRDGLAACQAPVIAVSPVIKGEAVKGPTAKMMVELGLPVSAPGVAAHYGDLLDGFVVDDEDRDYADALKRAGLAVAVTNTIMHGQAEREDLARVVLTLADEVRRAST
jgi:LPPG:FO 2-phospho-L-lactate transferase